MACTAWTVPRRLADYVQSAGSDVIAGVYGMTVKGSGQYEAALSTSVFTPPYHA